MLKDIKDNMLTQKKSLNLTRETETIKKGQMEII